MAAGEQGLWPMLVLALVVFTYPTRRISTYVYVCLGKLSHWQKDNRPSITTPGKNPAIQLFPEGSKTRGEPPSNAATQVLNQNYFGNPHFSPCDPTGYEYTPTLEANLLADGPYPLTKTRSVYYGLHFKRRLSLN